jgi:hypothetical protein
VEPVEQEEEEPVVDRDSNRKSTEGKKGTVKSKIQAAVETIRRSMRTKKTPKRMDM